MSDVVPYLALVLSVVALIVSIAVPVATERRQRRLDRLREEA